MIDQETKRYVQEKSAEFVAECPWFSLRKANRVITQLSNDLLQASGLRITQLAVLVTITVSVAPKVTALAEELAMDQSTLSRNLKPLERDGLIMIIPGTDRRTRVVTLTPLGELRLSQALPLWEQAKAAISELFGEREVGILLGMVSALSDLSIHDFGGEE